ncbi:MAG: hypothetical protein ACQESP_12215, partial [Candidatus Muiribacteriota bacterium]
MSHKNNKKSLITSDYFFQSKARIKYLVKILENPQKNPGFEFLSTDDVKNLLIKFGSDNNLKNLFINRILFDYKLKKFRDINNITSLLFPESDLPKSFLNSEYATYIPAVFCADNNAEVIYFYISQINSKEKIVLGNILNNLGSKEFKDSVINAHYFSGSESSFFAEVLKYNSNETLLTGKSASLSFYSGISFLSCKKRYPEKIICSASFDTKGNLNFTSDLNLKKQSVFDYDCRYFIVPLENYYDKTSLRNDIKVLPAENKEEALKIIEIAKNKGFEKEYLKFFSFPEEAFASLSYSIPENILRSLIKKLDFNQILSAIAENEDLFSVFIKNFMKTLDSDLEKASAITELCRDNDILLNSIHHDLSFIFCSCASLVYSRKGIPPEKNFWISRAEILMDKAKKTKKGRDALIWFTNYYFINSKHDKYIFSPEIPFVIKKFLLKTETIFKEECEFINGASEPSAGALCGTIAQNYGFCGENYFDKTEEYALKAIKYFGGKTNLEDPKLKHDILRQYNYLCFAALDLKDDKKAYQYFLKYAQSNDFKNALKSDFDQWGHFLASAFTARTNNYDTDFFYYNKYKKNQPQTVKTNFHPSQLWHYNMGLTALKAGENKDASQFFKKSIDICLNRNNGDTVRVMSLLPLSEIYFLDNCNVLYDEIFIKIKKSALKLAPFHFAVLFSDN